MQNKVEPIDPQLSDEILSEGCMRVPDVAKFLGLSKSGVYGLLARGEFPYIQAGRCVRIPKKAVWEYARKTLVQARSGPLVSEPTVNGVRSR